jgi:p24 family protein alpha
LEEVPKDTLVVGKYKLEDIPYQGSSYQPNANILKHTIHDPTGHLMLQKDLSPEGRFAFTSQVGGEHKICFQLSTQKAGWFGNKQKAKFHLDITRGEQATDYAEVAKQENLGVIEVEIRRLSDKIRDLRAEQNFQKTRELAFRDTSESTNTRVVWWSIIQTLILVLAGLWQITHLKNFFKAKKLV